MEDLDEPQTVTVGERLRAAREEKGIVLEDIASQTRIPRRHLESLETGDWAQLPAPTYTIGFAKSYASAVGLDRTEIGEQLRAEMGGQGPTVATTEVFEAADPARTMPKWLVLGAIAAVLLLVLAMSWLNRRSLDAPDADEAGVAAPADSTPASPTQSAAVPAAQGPVVITANEQVWFEVKDGNSTLRQGTLEAGQSYEVPATATAPTITTGKPEAIRISVGTADAPALGPAATTVRNVSLRPADLMRGPQSPAAASTPATGGNTAG